MKSGRLLASFIVVATVLLIAVGTIWPGKTALAFAGGESLLPAPNTPEAAVNNLAHQIGRQAWSSAYSSLANRAEFSESDFVRDLSGSFGVPCITTRASPGRGNHTYVSLLRPAEHGQNETDCESRTPRLLLNRAAAIGGPPTK